MHEVSEVAIRGRRFVFRRPLELEESFEHGHYCLYSPEIDQLMAFDKTPEAAMQGFADAFCVYWDAFAMARPSTLDAGARRLQEQLRSLVERVEEV